MKVTNSDIVQYITYIKVNYPKAFVFTGTPEQVQICKSTLIKSWYDILKDYPKEQCDRAVKRAVTNFSYGDYPKISDIVRELAPKTGYLQATNLWAEFLSKRGLVIRAGEHLADTFHNGTDKDLEMARKALVDVFNGLSIGLKRYFVNWDGLYYTATLADKALQYEKNTFFKTIKEQQEHPELEIISKEYGALYIKGNDTQLKIGKGEEK